MDINNFKNYFDLPEEAYQYVIYSKKINVIKNGHFAYSTLIKSDQDQLLKNKLEIILRKEKNLI